MAKKAIIQRQRGRRRGNFRSPEIESLGIRFVEGILGPTCSGLGQFEELGSNKDSE